MDATIGDTGAVTFGAFMPDPVRRRVSRGGAPIIMPARQFDLLLYLVRNPGRVVEKDELLSAVWGGELGRKDDAEKRLAKIHAALGDDGGTVYADIYAQWKRPDDALTWWRRPTLGTTPHWLNSMSGGNSTRSATLYASGISNTG